MLITLETIFKKKVDYHFCQVILLFWLQQKVVPYTKYKYKRNYGYFYHKLSRPQKKVKWPPQRSRPQVENHFRKLSKPVWWYVESEQARGT